MADRPVRLNGVWRIGGQILISNSRYNISAVTMIRQSVYRTTLRITPSNIMDSGQYSCQSDIASEPYILYADMSQQVAVIIQGTPLI